MRNCPVCGTTVTGAMSMCPTCRWPLRYVNIYDAELQRSILEWAKLAYNDLKAFRLNHDLPASRMNVQLGDPGINDLTSELVALNSRIKNSEDLQEKRYLEINTLFDKYKKIDEEILSIKKAIQGIGNFLKEQNSENKKFDDLIQSNEQTLKTYDIKMQELCQEQRRNLDEINALKSLLSNRQVLPAVMGMPDVHEPSATHRNNIELSFAPEELDLVSEYNRYPVEVPNFLRDRATSVSIDDDTFARLRDGNDSNITFKIDRKGNYLIIPRGGYRYLVPNKQRRIIAQIYITTKAIYNCDGYSESYQNFRLIKPALVKEEAIDTWQLSQKGILEFT